MLKTSAKIVAPSLLACVVVAGGCSNANKKANAKQASAVAAMNQAALNVPVAPAPPPAAPAEAYTPPAPPQPVVYDPPADQPVVEDAVVDASDSAAPVSRWRPRKTAASSAGTKYKVRKGESLWSIAQAKYGNGNKWKAIAAANPKIDPNRVQAGQTITLP
jgi:5'-nucleotidase